jgi:hypothetical protein
MKKVMLSDKNHKAMKLEALEILSVLGAVEDYLNQRRGVVCEGDFVQANFEDRFMKELNLELEAEVLTARDLAKIKKKALNVQRLLHNMVNEGAPGDETTLSLFNTVNRTQHPPRTHA